MSKINGGFSEKIKQENAKNYHLKLGAIGVFVSLAEKPSWVFRLRAVVVADVSHLRM